MRDWRPRGTRLFSTLLLAWAASALNGCELLVGNDPAVSGDGGGIGQTDEGGSNTDPSAEASSGDDGAGGGGDDGSSNGDGGSGTNSDATTAGQDATSVGNGDASVVGSDASTNPGQDATVDAPLTTPGGDGGPTCGMTVPAGWSLAIFTSGAAGCPTGFSEHNVQGSPTVGAGACSCACTVSQQGTCSHGTITFTGAPGHGIDTCTSAWFTAPAGGSTCITAPAMGFESVAANASGSSAGTGGACTTKASSDPTAITAPPERYCEVPSSSADAVCAGNAPSGFSACIFAPGDVACPASTPFVHAFPVQAMASVSCSTCSMCTPATTCGSPTVDLFTAGGCAGTPVSIPANGSCVAAGGEGTTFASAQYNANPSTTCTAGTSTATVERTTPQTICCR